MRGARVIGTAGAEGSSVVEGLGGEAVRYGAGLGDRVRVLAPDGVTVALDLVGTAEALDVSLDAVEDRSRIATIVPRREAFEAGVLVLGGGGVRGDDIRAAARADLARLAGEGRLTVTVAATFPLERAADAHRLLAGGHVHGKIVLIP